MSQYRQQQSEAFILHRRDYRETSRILTCFTRDHGRVDMICKGCRKAGKSNRIVEPFRHYRLTWSGRSDLKTLVNVDELQVPALFGKADILYCAFYLNELLSGVIRADESDQILFDLYRDTLSALAAHDGVSVQHLLRSFELSMIQAMGYGISLLHEADGETPIHPDEHYGLRPDHGFYRTTSRNELLARGDSILALGAGKPMNTRQERECKNLTRVLISYYLPNTKIQSRKLFT